MTYTHALKPLAERIRPTSLDNYFGQKHLISPGASLRKMIENQYIPNIIFWGPPGVGKTTLSEIIANQLSTDFYRLSAINSGVKEIREVIQLILSKQDDIFTPKQRPILFIDEIHRFSKSQQDSLLGDIERGTFSLIGATTENPSFELTPPLLSRSQVYTLKPLNPEDILSLISYSLKTDELLRKRNINLIESEALLHFSAGDARRALNLLEVICNTNPSPTLDITNELVQHSIQSHPIAFDKGGDLHYDITSAFIKSIRGSDPDAALYWLARLIEGGENPSFILRRLLISAAEDIGLANPNALLIVQACADIIDRVGWPEGRIPLAEATIYLACSEKSNTAYRAINKAIELAREMGNLPVPIHLRNASTKLTESLGYGADYRYSHDYPMHFVPQQYMPDAIIGQKLWEGDNNNQQERLLMERQHIRWGK